MNISTLGLTMRSLILILSLALGACGGSSSESMSAGDTVPAPTPTPTPQSRMLTLAPAADATLYEAADGSIANSRGPTLYAGLTQRTGELRRIVIRFDVSAIESDSVDSAALAMTLTRLRLTDIDFTVHRLLQSFSEGPSNAGPSPAGQGTAAQTGDATWVHRRFDDLTWDVAGGTYATSPSGRLTTDGTGRYVFESIERGMELDIESWVANPAENFGWIILGDEGVPASATEWASREAGDEADRPELTLTLSP